MAERRDFLELYCPKRRTLRSNGQTAAVTGDVGDEFRSVFDNVSSRAGICMQTDFLADWHGMTLPSPEFSR